ncbi:hypothetical protein DRQ53_10855 [bacterium]|nr:MAG: hypothetical protein DRQ53_10855 [bacterium]
MLPHKHLPALAGVFSLLVVFLFAGPAIADDDECLGCHAPAEEVVEPDYQVDPDAYLSSIHAELGFGCTDCHEGIEDYPHEIEQPATCSTCHDSALEEFQASAHGGLEAFGDESCVVCHSVHEVRAVYDPDSWVSLVNQPETCGKCHSDVAVVGSGGPDTGLVLNYENSVHGQARGSGKRPAVCSDCHGGHGVQRASHPESTTNPFVCQKTCAKCHEQQVEEYQSSVHWKAFERGRTAAPTCTVCHGIHSIKHVPAADASSHEARLVRTTCVGCHSSEALMRDANVASGRVTSYDSSYHGLVSQRGNIGVADCASCHGIHAILPSSDPRSSVAPGRLQETCGQCHPGAGVEFARAPVHFGGDSGHDGSGAVVIEWVKRIYWVLLIGVLGGMMLHNIIIVGWYIRRKWRLEKGAHMRRRFTRDQTIQHASLVISFVVLVISGFMLAYPGAWWVRMLTDAGIGEWTRRAIHRSAAGLMVAASLYHLYWMLFTPYGRQEVMRIAPKMRDVREVMQNMRFHLGSSEQRAAFAKFDYPAKAEYWALVWGTIVMILSGAVLLFPVVSTSFMSHWVIKLAEVIHLFEAWLATLAILIFHFFYVFGHPEVYPFNFAMFHGGMREEHAEHEHPGWAEEEEPRDL